MHKYIVETIKGELLGILPNLELKFQNNTEDGAVLFLGELPCGLGSLLVRINKSGSVFLSDLKTGICVEAGLKEYIDSIPSIRRIYVLRHLCLC